jgi:quercetin dioxygenase-like cupin family protein
MFVSHVDEIDRTPVKMSGVEGADKQVLIGPDQGWDNHVMRQFTLQPAGHTPRHTHPWPHINYITGGEGVLFLDSKNHRVKKGSIAYVPAGAEHQFTNPSEGEFSFLCIVPLEGEG